MTNSKEIIPVVAACIVDDPHTQVLLHRKNEAADEQGIPRNPELVGRWEFPGGMLRYGEDPYLALRREIREELAREIYIVGLIHAQTNIYKDKVHYLVLFYECKLCGDRMINGSQWFTPEEIKNLNVLPGTQEVVDMLGLCEETP